MPTADTKTASVTTFLTALALNAAIAGGQILAFSLVRRYFRVVYEPRSLSFLKAKRQHPLSPGLLGWPISVFNVDIDKIKDINGLDCYFFVRFLRMMVRVMLPIWLISWAVLIPLSSVHSEVYPDTGLDNFIFGNIQTNKQGRYGVHLVLLWIFTIWIWFNIRYEMKNYVKVRRKYLVSEPHSSTPQACSVLVTGIPPEYFSELSLTLLFDHLPGGVRQVWINRDLKDMPDLYKRRLKACDLLESAGTSLLNIALERNENKNKKNKVSEKDDKEHSSAGDPESSREALLDELVPRQKRPSHRLPLFSWMPFSLPIVGKKVDTIEWAREEVQELTTQLEQRREILAQDIARTSNAEVEMTSRKHNIGVDKLGIVSAFSSCVNSPRRDRSVDVSEQTYPPTNTAFILFNKQVAAHIAAQILTIDEPYHMSASQKYIEVAPEDVIWDNLTTNPYDRRVRTVLSWSVTIALIVLWTIPVTFIGFVSNIHAVCDTYHWLHWICKLPAVLVSFIQGVLPALLFKVLFMLLPIGMRTLARLEGIPQKTSVELSLMDRFFLFQVFDGFLVVIFSSGIIAALPSLVNHPTGVSSLLANNLPKSSTFFLTFIILQGLSGTASSFLQIGSLVTYCVKMILFNFTNFNFTARSVYQTKNSPRTEQWGTLFPQTTLLAVIAVTYSIISPIINGIAFVAFGLLYFSYKYLFTWVNNQPPSRETGGLFFPKAMNHIFIGLYVEQLCLCSLFFLSQNDKEQPSAIPEGVFTIVLIVFTAFFHNIIRNSYGPLIKVLPLTILKSSYNRAESKDPATTNAPNPNPPSSENVVGINYADVSTHASHQPVAEGRGGANGKESALSLLMKLVKGEGATDLRHPATVEEQRVIWLPKDPLGLVKEIERDLDSHDISHSTEWAKMNFKGRVDVNIVPEDD